MGTSGLAELAVLGGVLAAGTYVMICLVVFLQVRTLSRDDLRLLPADPARFGGKIADAQRHDAWLRERGFLPVTCCTLSVMRQALITVWQYGDSPAYVAIYHMAGQRVFDLVTVFADKIELTTGSSRDGQLMPQPPGRYVQTFHGMSLPELWEKHVAAEQFLVDAGARRLERMDRPFGEVLLESIREETTHVRSLLLWPLRGPYWYFVRRTRRNNRSIRQQAEAGWIRMPGEAPAGW